MRTLLRLLLVCLLLLALPSLGQHAGGTAPVLLVASTELQDPNFAQSVVLVLFPAGGWPTGVILNRPTRLTWTEAFPDEPTLRARADPIYFGGPVRVSDSTCSGNTVDIGSYRPPRVFHGLHDERRPRRPGRAVLGRRRVGRL